MIYLPPLIDIKNGDCYISHKSFFIWLQKSIGKLYGISEPLTTRNWEEIPDRIRKTHQDPPFYIDVLKNKCKYQSIIADTFWQSGSDSVLHGCQPDIASAD